MDNLPISVEEQRSIELIQRVTNYEQELLKLPPVELTYRHFFSEGIYGRECTMPAGTLVTGKIHKRQNLSIISKGKCVVTTDTGVRRIEAPYMFVAPPGTKRLLYIIEDTVWICVHPTHERDLAKIEKEFIAQDLDEYLAYKASLLPGREWDGFSLEELL